MGNILGKVNNSELTSIFTNNKEKRDGDAEVIYHSVIPIHDNANTVVNDNKITYTKLPDNLSLPIYDDTVMGRERTDEKMSDSELIDFVVNQLNARDNRMKILNEIISRLDRYV